MKVAARSAGSSRLPSTVGSNRIGTARIAYVQAVANQVLTRLVPPATKAGNSTLAGSLRMSGQSNVEDNIVAAAANARAPTTNSPPVVRRRRLLVLVVVMARSPNRWQHQPGEVALVRGAP